MSGIDLHIIQQRAGSLRVSRTNADGFPLKEEGGVSHTDDDYEDGELDDEDEDDHIDKISQFNFNLLSLFGLLLVLTHVWWIVDIILWCFGFYTTGLNGSYFGNPVKQCHLKSW